MKIVRFLILTAALLSVMLLPAAAWEQCPVHTFDYHSYPDTLRYRKCREKARLLLNFQMDIPTKF